MAAIGAILLVALSLTAAAASAAERSILVQSTTSTANTGLYDYLLPLFERVSGIKIHIVAVGTGQAIKNAKNGDADVLFVHSKIDEDKFVAEGYGLKRRDVMYNDFVVVGPASDPAGIAGAKEAAEAFRRIAEAKVPFASRGDDSGTHAAEKAIWKAAGVDPQRASGSWYRETGSAMGATLNAAVGMEAYALTDRGSWITFRNRGDHGVLVEGDEALFNQYGVILVNPGRFPHVKAAEGQAFIDWLVGPQAQQAIADYRVNGQPVFFPNARIE